MKVRAAVLALLLVALGSPASALTPPDYTGADGGWVVFSLTIGGLWLPTDVTVMFHRLDARRRWIVGWLPSGVLGHNDLTGPIDRATSLAVPDAPPSVRSIQYFTSVYAIRLPPGKYAITFVQVKAYEAPITYSARWDKDEIPFEVTAGRATYVGGLGFVPVVLGKNVFGQMSQSGWRRLLLDEADRDLAIARQKSPGLGPVDRAGYLDNAAGSPFMLPSDGAPGDHGPEATQP
jgi:hypothetical protein